MSFDKDQAAQYAIDRATDAAMQAELQGLDAKPAALAVIRAYKAAVSELMKPEAATSSRRAPRKAASKA